MEGRVLELEDVIGVIPNTSAKERNGSPPNEHPLRLFYRTRIEVRGEVRDVISCHYSILIPLLNASRIQASQVGGVGSPHAFARRAA